MLKSGRRRPAMVMVLPSAGGSRQRHWRTAMSSRKLPRGRKGQLDVQLSRAEFGRRFRAAFFDPQFVGVFDHVDALEETAWNAYEKGRKAPRTVRAGVAFADPDYQLSVEWLETRKRVHEAQRSHARRTGPARVLIIDASPRNDQTCPGEMSKTHRLAMLAREVLDTTRGIETELLDLSRLTAEYGRVIY